MSLFTRHFPLIRRSVSPALLALAVATGLAPVAGYAQPAPRQQPAEMRAAAPNGPRPITLDDYPKFRRITGAAISNDGAWMHYTIAPNEGDATLYVKSLDTDTA